MGPLPCRLDPPRHLILEPGPNLCKLSPMQSASKFTIGLVQMRAAVDAEDNLARAVSLVEQAAGSGAQVVCLPELFRCQYFCQREDASLFDLAEPLPCITTAPPSSTPKAKSRASTARCTYQMIPLTTRSSTSHRAIWAFAP